MRETTPSDKQWKTDSRKYRVVIIITKDDNGNLVSNVEYPDGFPKFVNKKIIPKTCERYWVNLWKI
jgi:hypothetical protein